MPRRRIRLAAWRHPKRLRPYDCAMGGVKSRIRSLSPRAAGLFILAVAAALVGAHARPAGDPLAERLPPSDAVTAGADDPAHPHAHRTAASRAAGRDRRL